MVDKIVKSVHTTRKNWWEAFKMACNIHGYNYYEIPPELRYRYPAPGSCALEEVDHPNLYKKHWKTPFRDSVFNIRQKEKKVSHEVNTQHIISEFPTLDLSNPLHAEIAKEQQGNFDHLIVDDFSEHAIDSPEAAAELQAHFAAIPQLVNELSRDFAPYHNDYDDDYAQVQIQYRDRDATGMGGEIRMKAMFVELEFWIENVIGAEQIQKKQINMYKGQVKKWQILDDAAHPREQIEKIQAAVQAPLPEELEMYKEKHSVPMQLPFNNQNATAWRDEAKAIDSADFDPDFLQIDREKRRRFFIERYEKPKELTE